MLTLLAGPRGAAGDGEGGPRVPEARYQEPHRPLPARGGAAAVEKGPPGCRGHAAADRGLANRRDRGTLEGEFPDLRVHDHELEDRLATLVAGAVALGTTDRLMDVAGVDLLGRRAGGDQEDPRRLHECDRHAA